MPTTKRVLRDPKVTYLRPEHTQQLRDYQLLIQHHQAILANLQQQAGSLIQVAYGIDVNQGQWVIDYTKGTLKQEEVPK